VITESRLSDLLAALNSFKIVDLEQPRTIGMPCFPTHWPGYNFTLHRRHEPGLGSRTSAAGVLYVGEHTGTHIDAFCHQAWEMEMFGGVEVNADIQTPSGFTQLGVDTIEPMVRRGVLLDVAAREGGPLEARRLLTADDLQSTADAQGTEIRPGDVLLVRVGWGPRWTEPDVYMDAAGMDRGAAEWAAGKGVFAVGADNMSWDLPGYTDPVLGSPLPCHMILLVRSGVHIIENLLLEELSATGAHEFVFVCAPLKYVGGTGGAVRPIAIVPSEAE
jgi:kynurenine formamidase